jgi:hypothetical protein
MAKGTEDGDLSQRRPRNSIVLLPKLYLFDCHFFIGLLIMGCDHHPEGSFSQLFQKLESLAKGPFEFARRIDETLLL